MKKRFVAKNKNKKKNKMKIILFLLIVFISFFFTIRTLAKISLPNKNDDLIKFLIENNNPFIINNKSNYTYFHKVMTKLINIDIKKPETIINNNYKGLTKIEEKEKIEKVSNEITSKDPIVYIYNTHDTEEYKPTSFAEYSIMPTVKLVNYILEEKLEDNNINVIIEEISTKDIRTKLGLNYAGSYKASRYLMEEAKNKNKTLKYFIDIHRDSLTHEKTTLNYNNKNYAKILFIIGLENKNYQENLEFTTKINDSLNNKIPGISKGIYKKEGVGVNGIYNQDFSNRTILIEVGGKDNKIEEVYETILILSETLTEVIKLDQN